MGFRFSVVSCCLQLAFMQFSALSAQQVAISINADSVYQTIQGFGGFGAKKVWWDPAPHWDQEYVNQVIDNLGCSFIRTQIYWESETSNDNADPDVFNWDKISFGNSADNNGKQLDFLKAVSDKGARILATVWTPPVWMKGLEEFHGTMWDSPVRRRPSNADLNSNNWWCGGAAGCTQVGGWLKPEYYGEFAEYLIAYLKTVKEKTGVDIWAINIQNEPWFPNPFESCVVIPSEYADLLKVVGARFAEEGIDCRLFGPEHMGEVSWGINREYMKEILADPSVKPYLSFFAVHSYVDGVAADYGSAEGWSALYNEVVRAHEKELWMTETSDFTKTGFDLAFEMAKSLHLALRFGRISGWVYWAMADAVIKDNRLTPLGYALKQYYKYVLPGSVQVKSTCTDKDLLVTAFRNGDDCVIVLINNGLYQKQISIDISGDDRPELFKAFRTSATESCLFTGEMNPNEVNLPAKSITTLTSSSWATNAEEVVMQRASILHDSKNGSLLVRSARGSDLQIHAITGNLVFAARISCEEEVIPTNRLGVGVYLVSLSGPDGMLSKKIFQWGDE